MNKSSMLDALFDEFARGNVNVDTYNVEAGYGIERYEKSVVLTNVKSLT